MPQTRPTEADAHIHANTCHYVKALLAAALAGETPRLEGFIVTNSCDGMRRLYDVWREYVPGVPAFFLDIPKKRDTDAIALFASELRRLAEALRRELPNAGITDERLENSIRTCNAIRRQMREVLAFQKEAAPRVRGSDFFDLTSEAADLMPSELRDGIDQFLSKIDQRGGPARGPRIVLSGNVINRPDLLTLIEDSGAHIVALDTCFGVRHYDLLVEENTGEPMLALATRYLLRSSSRAGLRVSSTAPSSSVIRISTISRCSRRTSGKREFRSSGSRTTTNGPGWANCGPGWKPFSRCCDGEDKDMLKQILQSMVQPSAALPSEAADPRAVWLNEWARLMLDAYEQGKTVIYTSCYAFPGELLASFDVAQFDFELAASMFGLNNSALPRLTEAEGRGCPMDMCSLHRLAPSARSSATSSRSPIS
jgi:hypothetical protein